MGVITLSPPFVSLVYLGFNLLRARVVSHHTLVLSILGFCPGLIWGLLHNVVINSLERDMLEKVTREHYQAQPWLFKGAWGEIQWELGPQFP